MEPTVRLLSHTAYPLETLYLAAVSLDNPELPYQSPHEICMLLYTELSNTLKPEQKQFILDTMRKEVSPDCSAISSCVSFSFILENIDQLLGNILSFDYGEITSGDGCGFKAKSLFVTDVVYICRMLQSNEREVVGIANQICEEIKTKVHPYLYQLLTEKK